MIENDLVDCMIALPGQLFYTTQIPVCLWFLSKNKKADGAKGYRDRQGETLFIDARNIGAMIDRTHKELSADDIAGIADTYHQWRSSKTLTPSPSPEGRGEHKLPLPLGEGRGEGEKPKKKAALPEKLLSYARELRASQTDAEKLLWKLLRSRRIAEAKFRRQHPLDNYILDFYCHEQKLAIELDGSQHFEDNAKNYDEKRTEYLNQQGIKVLRFDNRQMLVETEAVLEVIFNEIVAKASTLTPSPYPKGRGGQETLSQLDQSPSPSGRGARGEGVSYQDQAGYCKSATLADIEANDYVLTPGRYVGAAPIEDDGIPFEVKMTELSQTLYSQMEEEEKLDAVIRKNLGVLGYGE